MYLWNVLTSFFFFFVVLLFFFFFNPSSHGHRMTQIGNTISGVTGLRSVWWMLVTLSPSLLTPGSKCMHGRSELNALHKLQSPSFSSISVSNPVCFFRPHTQSHRAAASCTQTSPLCLRHRGYSSAFTKVEFACWFFYLYPLNSLIFEHASQTNLASASAEYYFELLILINIT